MIDLRVICGPKRSSIARKWQKYPNWNRVKTLGSSLLGETCPYKLYKAYFVLLYIHSMPKQELKDGHSETHHNIYNGYHSPHSTIMLSLQAETDRFVQYFQYCTETVADVNVSWSSLSETWIDDKIDHIKLKAIMTNIFLRTTFMWVNG